MCGYKGGLLLGGGVLPTVADVAGWDAAMLGLAVSLAVVLPLSAGDPTVAIALASGMAVVSGLVCIGIGVLGLGFVTELLSKPIRYGYMNGIALTVLISQLPKLFGFSIEGEGPLRDAVLEWRMLGNDWAPVAKTFLYPPTQ